MSYSFSCFWLIVISICAAVTLVESITLFLVSRYTHQAHWKRFCSFVPFAFAIWFLIEVYRGWSAYAAQVQWTSAGDGVQYIPIDQMAMMLNNAYSIEDQGPPIVAFTFVLWIIGIILLIVFLQKKPSI